MVRISLYSGTTDGSNHTTEFTPPIKLDENKQYELALVDGIVVNSIYNVSAALGNNTFKYTIGGGDWVVTFPDGIYSINGLNFEIQRQMVINHTADGVNDHYYPNSSHPGDDDWFIHLRPSFAAGKLYFHIHKTGVTVDLTNGSTSTFYALIGHAVTDTALDSTDVNLGVNTPDLNAGIEFININCNLIHGSGYSNGSLTNSLYTFKMDAAPYYERSLKRVNPSYYPITENIIREINIRVTDQSGTELSLNGEKSVFILDLRERR